MPYRPHKDATNDQTGPVTPSGDPKVLHEEELTYSSYLRIPELVTLQQPLSNPEHHDEMLFIIIHQAYELWFKLILHELERTLECLNDDHSLRARHFLHRCVQIMKLLTHQIHILETMNPAEFLGFRDNLMVASGFQSLQFREIEFIAGLKHPSYLTFFKNRPEMTERLRARLNGPDLRLEVFGHLRRKGYPLPQDIRLTHLREHPADRQRLLQTLEFIYNQYNNEQHLPVYLLIESCLEFDQQLNLWRSHHVRIVERIIGHKRGTGGSSGVDYLKKTTRRRIFPYLWDVRTLLGNNHVPSAATARAEET